MKDKPSFKKFPSFLLGEIWKTGRVVKKWIKKQRNILQNNITCNIMISRCNMMIHNNNDQIDNKNPQIQKLDNGG